MRLSRTALAAALVLCSLTGVAQASGGWRTPAGPILPSVRVDPALSLPGSLDRPEPVILTFDSGLSASDRTRALAGLGVPVTAYRALPMAVAVLDRAGLARALALSGLRSAYRDVPMRWFTEVESSSVRAIQTRAPAPAGLGFDGTGIGVAIIDTGVDGTHPDLPFPQRVVQNVLVRGRSTSDPYNLVLGPPTPPVYVEDVPDTDYLGHGTQTAGIIVGSGASSGGREAGLAPGARLVSLAANENASVPYVLASFDYVLDHPEYNVKVVNGSFGAVGQYDPEAPINVATKLLADQGITMVWAAGNSGSSDDSMSRWAQAPHTIGVGLADLKGRVDGSSSRGAPDRSATWPTVIAPGNDMTVTNSPKTAFGAGGGPNTFYGQRGGTSSAAPVVAATVAVMQQAAKAGRGRYLTPAEAKHLIEQTATPVRFNDPWAAGAGQVDTWAAVKAAADPAVPVGAVAPPGSGLRVFNDPADRVWADTVAPAAPPFGQPLEWQFEVSPSTERLDVRLNWEAFENDLRLEVTGPGGVSKGQDRFAAGFLTGLQISHTFVDPPAGTWTARVRLPQGPVVARPDDIRVHVDRMRFTPAAGPSGDAFVDLAVERRWLAAGDPCDALSTDDLLEAAAAALGVRQIVPGPAAARAPGAAVRNPWWGDPARFRQEVLVEGGAGPATPAAVARALVRALYAPKIGSSNRADMQAVLPPPGADEVALARQWGLYDAAGAGAGGGPVTRRDLALALVRWQTAAFKQQSELGPATPIAVPPC